MLLALLLCCVGSSDALHKKSALRAFGHKQGEKRRLPDAKHSDAFKLRSEAGGAAQEKSGPANINDRLHILFSTSCNEFQHWQAEVVVSSAMRVGQRGKITQIVVGCDEREDKGVKLRARVLTHPTGDVENLVSGKDWAKSAAGSAGGVEFNRLFAPSIPQAKAFPWYNKPWSFKYFLMHGNITKDSIIVIIDPDEFFIEPLTIGHTRKELIVSMEDKYLKPIVDDINGVIDVPKPGTAVTQVYGIGGSWINRFDRNSICGAKSYCATMDYNAARNYYSAGPPYLIHEADFRKMMPTWWDFMAPVYKRDKHDIQADMYAYTMAAAHQDIKHVSLTNYMVSSPGDGGERAWKYVDDAKSISCHDPKFPAGSPRPTFLHAAHHFKACSGGDWPRDAPGSSTCDMSKGSELWSLHKGHVPAVILRCEEPLMVQPPDDLINVQRKQEGKRQAFMVCMMTKQLNDMLLDYRTAHCPDGFNSNKCVRSVLEQPPSRHDKDGDDLINPSGYSLARLQCGSVKKQGKDGKAVYEKKEFKTTFRQVRSRPHAQWGK
eukprot:g2169.t1